MNLQYMAKRSGEVFFHTVLRYYLRGCSSVLDVGCGSDSPLQYAGRPLYKEGIDIYKKSIEQSKKKKIHDHYTIGDVRKLTMYYKPKSFDAAICIDVIEHLTEKEGIALMKQMERIARKRVILLTPNGFYEQHALENNPYQVHKSGWTVRQFRARGFHVYGLRGLQILRDDHASIKYKPWWFWGALSFLSELLLYPFPELSFDFLVVKESHHYGIT